MNIKNSLCALIISFFAIQSAAAAQTFAIDASHASIGFTIDHLVISQVRGVFRTFDGILVLDEEGQLSDASATIAVESIDTGIEGRDNHLKSADFFNAAEFPEITFKANEIKEGMIVGDLTIHGITKEIELPYTVKGPIKDPFGKTRIGFQAQTVINRTEFGLTWNNVVEGGGLVVGEEVNLDINFEAIQN